jgi:flavin reductase (DIM6/NTAB) family NADH-FMN oxidoreductase RutF
MTSPLPSSAAAPAHTEVPLAAIDQRVLRDALGTFATGIAIVTALAPDGEKIGLTINSFNSVSLDPALIVWSLSLNSPRFADLVAASHFAVNILAADQVDLSNRFAGRDADRFSGVATCSGLGGAPLFSGSLAWLECANEIHYDGGDHLIFIGRVERVSLGEQKPPLIYLGGRYRELAALVAPPTAA